MLNLVQFELILAQTGVISDLKMLLGALVKISR